MVAIARQLDLNDSDAALNRRILKLDGNDDGESYYYNTRWQVLEVRRVASASGCHLQAIACGWRSVIGFTYGTLPDRPQIIEQRWAVVTKKPSTRPGSHGH